MSKVKKATAIIIILAAISFAAAVVYWYSGGVSHKDIRDTILVEHSSTRNELDRRAGELEKNLDRIESKLDRLLELANPTLPDDMRKVN